MAITGSTRMQATTIQLCVLLTMMEMVMRELLPGPPPDAGGYDIPKQFLAQLIQMHSSLKSPEVLSQLAKLVALEESVYRAGHKNNYFADDFAIDVLTDTTERSPTYCTPPFRKFDDQTAAESWSFLFTPGTDSLQAWIEIMKREPNCVEWSERETRELVGDEKFARTYETVRKISRAELMRFKIGLDGLPYRPLGRGDSAIGILSDSELESSQKGFYGKHLEAAKNVGARLGWIYFTTKYGTRTEDLHKSMTQEVIVNIPLLETNFVLDGVTRAGVKMLLNALSTCTMVRLGRVMGNYMIWVVASNLKLIDRATRYIEKLTGLAYDDSNRLLFEVVEYIEPRMKADQAYPPVVGLAVLRAKHKLTNEQAEEKLKSE
jgi:N-acetylmuramic acid 6-phosphate etherase